MSDFVLSVQPKSGNDDQRPSSQASIRLGLMKPIGPFGKLAIFLAVYLAACTWGAKWATGAGAALWPPDAVLLVALLFDRPERWWWYLLAAMPIRWFVLPQGPQWFLLVAFANDALKAVLSASLLRRLLSDAPWLNTLRDFARFVVVAAVLSPVLSAIGGAASRVLFGNSFWPVWLQWFLGDSLAIIALVPAFLFAAQARFGRPIVSPAELIVLTFTLVGGSWLAFWYADRAATYTPILLYAPIPALVWAAVRFGPAGASISLAFIVLFALAAADQGHGPFIAYGHAINLLAVQLFLTMLTLPLTTLTLLIDERRKAQQSLAWSRGELQAQNVQLRTLAGRLMTAYEDERQQISRDLHDDIGQRLALIAMAIDRINLDHHESPSIVGSGLQGIRTEVHELASDLHGLSRELYSSTVQHLGLSRALRNWCTQMAAQHHLAIEFIEDGHDGLPRDASMCLYRVAQEALKNAVKHGRAQQVTVELTSDSASMRLRVTDSGGGFDPGAPTNGIGLASMRERLRFIGGALSVRSTPGNGVEVTAVIPATDSQPAARSLQAI